MRRINDDYDPCRHGVDDDKDNDDDSDDVANDRDDIN